jgi:hypothetical protein
MKLTIQRVKAILHDTYTLHILMEALLMRTIFNRGLILAILLLIVAAGQLSAQTWDFIGPKGHAVNCILAENTSLIFAGTDTGIYVYTDDKWTLAYSGLPVLAIARLVPGVVVAAVGNGSVSDGLYIGTQTLSKPPYYTFALGQHVENPTALAVMFNYLNTGDTLVFTGSGNNIYKATYTVGKGLASLSAVKGPALPFGRGSPLCAAMLAFQGEVLFVGGYDENPLIRPGTGTLLRLMADSLRVSRSLRVTSLADVNIATIGQSLVVGTLDSGVLCYDLGSWTNLGTPSTYPIKAVAARPSTMTLREVPIAAAADGVFSYSGTWSELGKFPDSTIACIVPSPFIIGTFVPLLAGTGDGAYQYAQATAVQQVRHENAVPRMVVSEGNNVKVSIAGTSAPIEILITNAQGRVVKKITLKGSSVTFKLPGAGVYYYTCTSRDAVLHTGIIRNTK